jgi:teichuronic acid biosynthesis glycosyltransferase TuaC
VRILVVVKDFPTAGNMFSGIFILRRLQALRTLGHEFRVFRIVPHAPPFGVRWRRYWAIPDSERVDGFLVRTGRAIFPPRMIGMEYVAGQLQKSLEREVREFRPELLHASFLVPCGQLAVRQTVPTIVTTHGGDGYAWPFLRPGLYRAAHEALSKAARVTAVSHHLKECIQSIVKRDVVVIWNGGDPRTFFPREKADCRLRLGFPRERFIIAFAGSIVRAKGVFDLVDAVERLGGSTNPLLVFAGAGQATRELNERAARARVDIRLVGQRPQEGLADIFGAADVVALPSYNEGLPNVICEAMLSGRAVLATAVGGIPEIIRDHETGLLAPPGDPGGLATRIRELVDNPSLLSRLGQTAQAFAGRNLTWEASAKKYDKVFRETLDCAVDKRRAFGCT